MFLGFAVYSNYAATQLKVASDTIYYSWTRYLILLSSMANDANVSRRMEILRAGTVDSVKRATMLEEIKELRAKVD